MSGPASSAQPAERGGDSMLSFAQGENRGAGKAYRPAHLSTPRRPIRVFISCGRFALIEGHAPECVYGGWPTPPRQVYTWLGGWPTSGVRDARGAPFLAPFARSGAFACASRPWSGVTDRNPVVTLTSLHALGLTLLAHPLRAKRITWLPHPSRFFRKGGCPPLSQFPFHPLTGRQRTCDRTPFRPDVPAMCDSGPRQP